MIAVGVLALTAPIAIGTWSLQFLSLLPLAVGIANFYATLTSPELRVRPVSYATGLVAVAVAILLYVSPSLVVSGIIGVLLALLVTDGAIKIGQSIVGSTSGASRLVPLANGVTSLVLALAGWFFWRNLGIDIAVGVMIGGYTVASGWSMMVSPLPPFRETAEALRDDVHPDPKLRLGPNKLFAATQDRLAANAAAIRQREIYWLIVCGLILFILHLSRMQSTQTWLGLISPQVAMVGDIFMAFVLGAFVVLPFRLSWRCVSRPMERAAWRLRFSGQDAGLRPLPQRIVRYWTDGRYAFAGALRDARTSLYGTGVLALRLGLPLAALMAAVNPIWGFSWYFNTES